jgi:hypothetical protein
MSLSVAGIAIDRISIIDDDEVAREGYEGPVAELGAEAVLESGPLPDVAEYVVDFDRRANAAICDYYLRKKGSYSSFNGDVLAAELYKRQTPAVLCTSFEPMDLLRRTRRYIPVLLKVDELDPDNIAHGFETCIEEFAGRFRPHRKSWRTLIRVEDVEREGPRGGYFYVVLPGWNDRIKVRIPFDDVPEEIRPLVEVDRRFHAQVNVGAQQHEELYFWDWETK